MGDTPSIPSSFLQSLRRRWKDASMTTSPSTTHQQHVTSHPSTSTPNSEITHDDQDDRGPGAKLPLECIELIVGHMEDLWTLWSLLTVNKRFAAVVLRRLYTNPYRSILMGFLFHEGIPIRRLAHRILTLTHVPPGSDPFIESMKRALKIQDNTLTRWHSQESQQHIAWVDYLALIRELEWPNDIWEELHEFFQEIGTEMHKDMQLIRNKIGGGGGGRTLLNNSAQVKDFMDDPRWSCPPALVQSTLTWAACGGSADQLGRIKKIWIPIQDIERYLDPNIVAQFVQLEEVVFDGRYATMNTDFEATYRNGIDFVRAHRNYHLNEAGKAARSGTGISVSVVSGARLDSARFESLSWRGYEHLERELYSLLPPLKPRHLTKINWRRFMIKPHETDTSRVESIFYEEPDKVEWDPYLPKIPSFLLPSCRRLVRLRLRIRPKDAATIFRWAVEEKNKRKKMSSGINIGQEGGHGNELVRLEELDLTCDRGTMQQVIQDTMFAFGHSLRVVNILPTIEAMDDYSDSETAMLVDENYGIQENNSNNSNNNNNNGSNGLDETAELPSSTFHGSSSSRLDIGAGWNLPCLVRLCIVSDGPSIELDPTALTHCRRLELVRLRDDALATNRDATQSAHQSTYDEWMLPNAMRIKLIGNPATKFNPGSLTWMKRLTWLELSTNAPSDTMAGPMNAIVAASDTSLPLSLLSPSEAGHDAASATAPSSSLPLPTQSPWTWDWDLLMLQTLILVGDTAISFELKMLKHTPSLRALSLNVQRCKREFSWTAASNVCAPHLEELCLTGRWFISNETLRYILLGGSESSMMTQCPSAAVSALPSSTSPLPSLDQQKTKVAKTIITATPCPALSHMQLIRCYGYNLQELVKACEQRRPRTLKNVRCSQSLSEPDARMMGLEPVDQSHLMYSNPYAQDVISYSNWVTYHNRNQGLLSMLSSPASQQPTVCVYTMSADNFRYRRWQWKM